MKRKKVLTKKGIKASIEGLQKRLKKALKESEQLDEKMRKLREEITEVQSQCPHKTTKEKYEQDCAELKLRKFCTDCGARI